LKSRRSRFKRGDQLSESFARKFQKSTNEKTGFKEKEGGYRLFSSKILFTVAAEANKRVVNEEKKGGEGAELSQRV